MKNKINYDVDSELRSFLSINRDGVLSSISVDEKINGFPFGSLVPFSLDSDGHPIIQISDLSQHTKNIKANPRVSLTIYERLHKDVQANTRFTIIGNVEKITEDELEDIKTNHFNSFPESSRYSVTHDFNFYRIRYIMGRLIAGFGKIFWISADDYLNKIDIIS